MNEGNDCEKGYFHFIGVIKQSKSGRHVLAI
jgi:hypothetical protein